jgi:shikimate kinase
VTGIPPDINSFINVTSTVQTVDDESTPALPPVFLDILPQRIVLTGFMGAGKSTVGRLLAERLGWRFIDVDDEIEAAQGATIAAIFTEHGEPRFRQLEHETIRRLLDSKRLILALGGGAIEDDRTRRLLLESAETRLVHLDASLDTVLLRCRGTEDMRPVLQDQKNLENRYRRRLPLYRQAHLTIAVDSVLPDVIVTAILADAGIA